MKLLQIISNFYQEHISLASLPMEEPVEEPVGNGIGKCVLKSFTERLASPVGDKYERCLRCTGYDDTRYCYVTPSQRSVGL